ncbi:sulfate transporter, partial [Trifolium medium]|nr:sulfate transporter [Trifolium medium]
VWVRLYGVPLHAWNENFFKLCVFDCGRFLRADSCTVEKERLDYARILLATDILEVVRRKELLLVEGELAEITIVEEWDTTLGDDCLFDDETASEACHSDDEVTRCDPEASNNVDMFVAKIAEDFEAEVEEEERPVQCVESGGKAQHQQADIVNKEVVSESENEQIQCFGGQNRECMAGDKEHAVLSLVHGEPCVANPDRARGVPGKDTGSGEMRGSDAQLFSRKRAQSCPPGANRSVISGPWSL